jgi:hypothetical protein
MTPTGYDIIGDIHGHADELKALLFKMGYVRNNDTFSHPEKRQAIFVGDIIDRGPKIRESLQIVKSMWDAGHALMTLGNHEVNALGYHYKDDKGNPLRKHTRRSKKQHQTTLNQFKEHPKELREYLEWFWKIPLFLDLTHLRIVHACWDHTAPEIIPNGIINISDVTDVFRRKKIPRVLLLKKIICGLEINIPSGHVYKDTKGDEHQNIRTAWWKKLESTTYKEAIFPNRGHAPALRIPEKNIPKQVHYEKHEKPIFFGHYWLKSEDYPRTPLTPNIACLDYSVAMNGRLTAYQWDGEQTLSADKFVCC